MSLTSEVFLTFLTGQRGKKKRHTVRKRPCVFSFSPSWRILGTGVSALEAYGLVTQEEKRERAVADVGAGDRFVFDGKDLFGWMLFTDKLHKVFRVFSAARLRDADDLGLGVYGKPVEAFRQCFDGLYGGKSASAL